MNFLATRQPRPSWSQRCRTSAFSHRHPQGFTLVELLCVVALLAIVVTLALPSFSNLIQKLRVHQAVMELKGALYLARSEAVRRSEDIKLRKKDSTETRTCTASPSDWSCGWMVFLDTNGNGLFEEKGLDGDTLLYIFPAPLNASVRFTSNASLLTVNRWGAINGVGAGFVITPQSSSSGSATSIETVVCVSSGGRVRSAPGNSCS